MHDMLARAARHFENEPARRQSAREDGESWDAFVQRLGPSEFEAQVKDLSMPVDFGLQTMNEFIDWNRNAPFEIVRGEGECAV